MTEELDIHEESGHLIASLSKKEKRLQLIVAAVISTLLGGGTGYGGIMIAQAKQEVRIEEMQKQFTGFKEDLNARIGSMEKAISKNSEDSSRSLGMLEVFMRSEYPVLYKKAQDARTE